MKRFFAALAVLLQVLLLSCSVAAAEDGWLSFEYVRRTEHGSLFYIDVFSDVPLGAAKLELEYPRGSVEYRTIETSAASSTVKAKAENGVVTVVLCDSIGVSGRICRLTFKALSDGEALLTLRMTEGVGGDLSRLANPPDASLAVTLGSPESAVSVSSGRRSGADYSGRQSVKTALSDEDGSSDDELPIIRDLSGNTTADAVVLGSAVGVLTLAVGLGCFALGRRSLKKKRAASDPRNEDEYESNSYQKPDE